MSTVESRRISVVVMLALLAGILASVAPAAAQTSGKPTHEQVAQLIASDVAAQDQFGYEVDVDGDIAVFGSPFDDDVQTNSGSAYVFVRTEAGWVQEAKLTAADPAREHRFGWSVSVDGDTVVVGAHADKHKGSNSGAAYVFVRTDLGWVQQAKLTASDAKTMDYFASPVAIDGDTIVAGAHADDDGGNASGSAYVFTRTDGVWTEQAKLTASDARSGDFFGQSVTVDGDNVVVGAWGDSPSGYRSGSAYVFTRTDDVWTEQAKLTDADGAKGDYFGWHVAMDGDTAVVGARFDDDGGKSAGSASVFVRSGSVWTLQAKLTAHDGSGDEFFGNRAAIDGDTLITGTFGDSDHGNGSGSMRVFTRTDGEWTEQPKLTALDAGAGHYFGAFVAIDGDTVLTSSVGHDSAGTLSGAVYVFEPARNKAPLAADDDITFGADALVAGLGTVTFDAPGVLANDVDPDGDPMTAALMDHPANGTVILNADGSFSYTPAIGFLGTDEFTYIASDDTDSSDPVRVTLTLTLP